MEKDNCGLRTAVQKVQIVNLKFFHSEMELWLLQSCKFVDAWLTNFWVEIRPDVETKVNANLSLYSYGQITKWLTPWLKLWSAKLDGSQRLQNVYIHTTQATAKIGKRQKPSWNKQKGKRLAQKIIIRCSSTTQNKIGILALQLVWVTRGPCFSCYWAIRYIHKRKTWGANPI